MPVEDIILKLRKYRFWLLFIFIFSFSFSFYIAHYYSSFYKAEVIFMVNDVELTDVGLTEMELTSAARTSTFTIEKFYRFLFSDELLSNIDKKIALGKHYGLSETQKDYFWKLSNRFAKRLLVVKNGFNFMNLTVMDNDAEYGIQLAEAIVYELKRMNVAYSQNVINERIQLYSLMQKDMKVDFNTSLESLSGALSTVKDFNLGPGNKDDLMHLQYSILKFSDKLDEVTDKLGNISKMYMIANQSAKPENLDKFYVINKKYYQSNTSDVYIDLCISFFISVLALIVIVLASYFYHINRHLFHLFFKGTSS